MSTNPIELQGDQLWLTNSRGFVFIIGFRYGIPAYLKVLNNKAQLLSCFKVKGASKRPSFPDAEAIDKDDLEQKVRSAFGRGLN
jgi:hypothetical protein